ncbi:hypothetical protein Adt_21869 [Abeliophyllum distichum]|uniref:Uncharacterized protein n=1 Tax=Abeliophyllum distichum TaxID=126358 RepID=A0ABD1T0M9_9LAMI
MNLIRWLLTKKVYSTLEGLDGKLGKEEANSKKLSKDLKAMSLEKAQLESDERFLQVHQNSMVTKENNLKAKFEIKLKATKKCLKDTRDQKKASSASEKHAEEPHKLAKERALAAETAVAIANSTFEAMVVEKDKLLAEAKEEVERVKIDRTDAEARTMVVY